MAIRWCGARVFLTNLNGFLLPLRQLRLNKWAVEQGSVSWWNTIQCVWLSCSDRSDNHDNWGLGGDLNGVALTPVGLMAVFSHFGCPLLSSLYSLPYDDSRMELLQRTLFEFSLWCSFYISGSIVLSLCSHGAVQEKFVSWIWSGYLNIINIMALPKQFCLLVLSPVVCWN